MILGSHSGTAAIASAVDRRCFLPAEHGYRQAQVNLGSMYRDGQGTSQNYGEAMHWYRNAADQGSAVAEWMIGGLYFHGWGVTRDFTEAATWFRLSLIHISEPTRLGMISY